MATISVVSQPMAIITYSITHLTHCEKIKFYYVLKGRDGKPGIVQRTHTEQLGKGVLLVPFDQTQTITDFLKDWQCVFATKQVLVEVAQ